MKIFDAHAHVFPEAVAPKVVEQLEDYYKMKWTGKGTLEDLKNSIKEANVTKALIFSTATKPAQVETINTYISTLIGDTFVGFGTLHPDYEDYKSEIKRIKELGLKGIKLHPDFQKFNIDDDKMLKIYDAVNGEMPFLIHLGDENSDYSSPKRMARVLDLFPNMKLIGAHLGGYSAWDDAEKYLIGRDIYLDISSSFCKLSVDEGVRLIKKHGTDKIFFATDYPAIRHKEALEQFLALPFTEEEKNDILYNNAARLFGFDKC